MKSFFGIRELPNEAQNLVMKFFYIQNMMNFVAQMGITFIILDYIDEFGFAIAGILMAIVSFSQFISDYPTGSLGDYIGQRFVISISLLFFSFAYFLIAYFEGLNVYIISAFFFGLGIGQMSGAFESYLDNNYKLTSQDKDLDRKIYGFAAQRMGTITNTISSMSFLFGGLLSVLYFRKLVFMIVSVLLFLMIPIIIKYLKDVIIEGKTSKKSEPSHGYLFYLKGGVKYFVSSKESFLLIMGIAFLNLAGFIWFTLLLFPIYNAYTGTDFGVGLLRTFAFVTGAVLAIFTARITKSLNNNQFGKMALLYNFVWFSSFAILLTFIPATNSFNLNGVIWIVIIMLFTINGLGALTYTLQQRLLSVTIPSENRNSVYSLLPSISLLFQIPLLPITGIIVEQNGLPGGLLVSLSVSMIGAFLLLIYHFISNKNDSKNDSKNQSI